MPTASPFYRGAVWSPGAFRATIPGHQCADPGATWIEMNYDKLDNEELLRLSLDAVNGGHDADAVVMLKTLLERDPKHVFGQYLLAAQHAQLGMFDRAEAGFRVVIVQSQDFAIARFQLGQLLVMKGAAAEARQVLAPVLGQTDALGAYGRALSAAAGDDIADALRELDLGLGLPQEIPALAVDMQRLRDQLQQGAQQVDAATTISSPLSAAPMFLAGYGREG